MKISPRPMFWGVFYQVARSFNIALLIPVKRRSSVPLSQGQPNLACKLGCLRIFLTCAARHKRMDLFARIQRRLELLALSGVPLAL